LERLAPHVEKSDDYTKTYKGYPSREKFGEDYPHPTPEDFGITEAEFKDYNSRFEFKFYKNHFYLWTLDRCLYLCSSGKSKRRKRNSFSWNYRNGGNSFRLPF